MRCCENISHLTTTFKPVGLDFPRRMSRDSMQPVAVIGPSCAGKTTFARTLAERTGCVHIELDAVHWGPGWTERPRGSYGRRSRS